MKKLALIACMSIVIFGVRSQEKTRQQEIGLSFNSLNSFGLNYKIGNQKSMWRFNSLFLNGTNHTEEGDSSIDKRTNNGFQIAVGKEFRKPITENLELRYGADLAFRYSKTLNEYDDQTVNNQDVLGESTSYMPGVLLVFGLNYVVNDHFIIGAEIQPGFYYTTGNSKRKDAYVKTTTEAKISGFSYSMSSNSAAVTLAYRF